MAIVLFLYDKEIVLVDDPKEQTHPKIKWRVVEILILHSLEQFRNWHLIQKAVCIGDNHFFF